MKNRNYTNIMLLILIAIGITDLIFQIISAREDNHHGYVDFDKMRQQSVNKKKNTIKKPGFLEPVDPDLAQWGVETFRNIHNYGEYFIVYDTSDLTRFIHKFDSTIKSLDADEKRDSCWKIGLYPYIRPITINSKEEYFVDMLVVPTIIPRKNSADTCYGCEKNKGGFDYFKDETGFYNKSKVRAYDFGNMHP